MSKTYANTETGRFAIIKGCNIKIYYGRECPIQLNSKSENPLFYLVKAGETDIVEAMLEAEPSLSQSFSYNGYSLISYDEEMNGGHMRTLLSKYNASTISSNVAWIEHCKASRAAGRDPFSAAVVDASQDDAPAAASATVSLELETAKLGEVDITLDSQQ